MALTPGEADRLLLYTQGLLARERHARGLRLNVPESTAIIANAVCEAARDGKDLVSARETGRSVLGAADVLPGVVEIVTDVSVEARFDDGTRLVVVRDPFRTSHESSTSVVESPAIPSTGVIRIENCALTPIGLTSHIHLAEVNPRLRLDREAAYGHRLAIPSGDTIWIQPGETIELESSRSLGLESSSEILGLSMDPLTIPSCADEHSTLCAPAGTSILKPGRQRDRRRKCPRRMMP